MANQQRIEGLQQRCLELRNTLQGMTQRRGDLLADKNSFLFGDGNENLVPTLIQEADGAILQWQKILTKVEQLRDRAIRGEDV